MTTNFFAIGTNSCYTLLSATILFLTIFSTKAFPVERPEKESTSMVSISTHPPPSVFVVRHKLPTGVTPTQAYLRCVQIWREENLGLPWFVPFPILRNRGDDQTGVGLEVMRIPPFGLREGITDAHYVNDDSSSCWMEYKVLNPSWLTWPVRSHRGLITFQPTTEEDENVHTTLEWRVEWVSLPLVHEVVQFFTRLIISHAAHYLSTTTAADSSSNNNTGAQL